MGLTRRVFGFGNDFHWLCLLRLAADSILKSNFSLVLRGTAVHVFAPDSLDNNLL